MTEIKHLSNENFETEIQNKTVLLDFFAAWCGPCRTMSKNLENAAKDAPDGVEIAKIDISESPDIAATYQVASIPTLVLLKNGENVYQKTGVHTTAEILALLNQFA